MALAIALLLLSFQHAYSQYYGYINIDCGTEKYYAFTDTNNLTWYSDKRYINELCGRNHKINESIDGSPMNSLRFFPDQNKNCYTLPAFIQQKYLIRAGFYYGNYDGLSRPPTFDLQFDTSQWAMVVTSENRPVFYEAVVMAMRHNISVCVARTREGDIPFMSSLEMMQLLPGMYGAMESDRALFKQYMVNFGSNETVRFPDDKYGRIWEPAQSTGYTNLTADFQSLISTVPDDPPLTAVKTAIQSASPSDPIILSFNNQQPTRPTYVALYFIEPSKLGPNQNRTFDVYLNGQDYNLMVSPAYGRCSEVHGNTDPSAGPFNLTLARSSNSNLPPIISAMELYTVSEVVPNGTASEDIMGLEWLSHQDSLARWSGDPCLPVAWEWLACNQEDPPRITSLYLANYGITYLGDFSDMKALEIIDLQNNNISGHIPDFFGELPNLKELNLANNKLWGTVPESLLNSKLSLNVSGNPELIVPVLKKKKNHTGLIAGLVIGFVVLIIICVIVAFFCRRSNGERQITTDEDSRVHRETGAGPVYLGQVANERDPGAQGN